MFIVTTEKEIPLNSVALKEFVLNNVPSFLNTSNNQPMTADVSRQLMQITMAGDSLTTPVMSHPVIDAFMEKDLVLNILVNRLPEESRKLLSLDLAVFLTLVIDSPGVAVQWAWTVHSYIQWRKINQPSKTSDLVTLNDFIHNVFPYGLPTESEISRIWSAQKCDRQPDNLLDHAATWEV